MIIDQKNYTLHNLGEKAKKLFIMRENDLPVPYLLCITEEVPDNLTEILMREGENTLWAVRSSHADEDGAEFSFAGQFSTLLNISARDVPNAAKLCLKGSAQTYAENMHLSADGQIAVIIQKMVDADISGVMFSANPLGMLNESVITAGKGTGAVVGGDSPATSYYLNKTDGLIYYSRQENAPLLSESQLAALNAACGKIIGLFGDYVDIEYAFADGKLHILQCRPITAMPSEPQTILDSSNISESYPGISLPLTISFVHDAYTGIFKGLARRCLKSRRLVSQYSALLENMTGSVNGRLYYKISSWYSVLKFLPFSKKIIPVWQEMMGVSAKEENGSDSGLSLLRRILTYFNALYEFILVPRNMRQLERNFNQISIDFEREFSDSLSAVQLMKLYDRIGDEVLSCWEVTLLNDLYAFLFTGLLEKKIGSEQANKFISGISDIESMKPVKALAVLAVKAEEDGYLKGLSALKSNEEAAEYFARSGEFFCSVREYIKLYGDRAPQELKLETETFRTSPLLLAKQLCAYCADSATMARLRELLDKQNNAGAHTYLSRSGKYYANRAALGIKNRETSRLNRCRIYGMIRRIFRALGDDFCRKGILDAPDSIFMLTVDEIRDLAVGNNAPQTAIINKRRHLWTFYGKLPAYSRLVFSGREFSKAPENEITIHDNNEAVSTLYGTPCSHGTVTGKALVIDGEPRSDYPSGKILVAKMTDPGWVFIMANAKGIISEKGSLLSHTAIISRELGLPAVTGVKNATSAIQTGDMITLNGSSGEIYVERHRN